MAAHYTKRLLLFASTQRNPFTGATDSEGPYCHRLCIQAKSLLESWGWEVIAPWKYNTPGTLDGLMAQKKAGIAAQKQGQCFVLSVHINWTGTSRKDGVLTIYRASRASDKVWAQAFGRQLGTLSGLGYEKTVDESFTSTKSLAIMDVPGPNILAELGEFGTKSESQWLEANESKLATALAAAVEQSTHDCYGTPLHVAPSPGTVTAATPLTGIFAGTYWDLAHKIHGTPLWLPEVAAFWYMEEAAKFNLRADILWAQARLETGDFTFTGQVPESFNNPCGLRLKDGSGFYRFDIPRSGIIAHCAHMAWHVFPDHVNALCDVAHDPKHGPHVNDMKTAGDLAIWADGTATYVPSILRRVNE